MKPTKFELMRKNRAKRASHVEPRYRLGARFGNEGLGGLGLHNSMSDPDFYSPQRGRDLAQQGLGGLFRQPNLTPSKEAQNADLKDAAVQPPEIRVDSFPERNVGVLRSAIRGLSMRIRKLAEKFSQFLR